MRFRAWMMIVAFASASTLLTGCFSNSKSGRKRRPAQISALEQDILSRYPRGPRADQVLVGDMIVSSIIPVARPTLKQARLGS